MDLQNKYIVVEGNIGAGKTSLVKKVAEQFNGKLILEQFHDNPFLPKFYKDPDRYSFTLELSFLAARYKQLNTEIQSTDLFKSFTVADYYFAKSLIFSQKTLQDDEYGLYRQLFDIIYKQLPLPNVYFYLHVNVDRLLQNIKKRGRDYEQEISAEYLQNIQQSYFSFFKTISDFPVVIIDCSDIDFVNNNGDYEKLVEKILFTNYNKGISRIVL